MRCHDKPHGFHTIENPATVIDNAVYQFTTFADLRSGLGGGINGKVLQFVCTFDVGVAADVYIFEDPAILDNGSVSDGSIIASSRICSFLCELEELLLQGIVVAVTGPQPGITGKHAVERNDLSSTIFIAYFQPDPDILHFTFFQTAIAKFGIVGGGEFIYIYNDHFVAHDIMRNVI